MSRAERRHHRDRLRGRVARFGWIRDRDAAELQVAISKHVDNRRPCSCWMCGNPRRYFGQRTRQEVRAGWPSHAVVWA